MIKRKTKIPITEDLFLALMLQENEKEGEYKISLWKCKDGNDRHQCMVYYNTTSFTKADERFSLIEKITKDNINVITNTQNWIFTINPIKFLIRHMN